MPRYKCARAVGVMHGPQRPWATSPLVGVRTAVRCPEDSLLKSRPTIPHNLNHHTTSRLYLLSYCIVVQR
jgi:hypothetical protein